MRKLMGKLTGKFIGQASSHLTGMQRRVALVITFGLSLALSLPIQAVDNAAPFADPVLQARYETLTHELRCLVCQNETIADSSATLAADLRRELREQLASGSTNEQILQFMTDRYGAFVLYNPPFEPRTWLLWLGPVLLLLIGVVVVVRIIIKRSRAFDPNAVDSDAAANSSTEL